MTKKTALYIAAMFLLGLGVLLYPPIQHQRFERYTQQVIEDFEARIEAYLALYHAQREANGHSAPTSGNNYSFLYFVNMWLSGFNYNMSRGTQEHLLDPFRYNHPSFNLERFGFDTEIIGVLSIPSIDVRLPIYLGTSAENLHRGAAHLTHSSFPVGGNSTNAVIAGHRSAPHARLFRDIESIEFGDTIEIANFHQTITYTVIETKVVNPHDEDFMIIQSNRDLVTIITTARMRSSRRYVVVAERTG